MNNLKNKHNNLSSNPEFVNKFIFNLKEMNKKSMNRVERRLRLFAQYLKSTDIYVDSYPDGAVERAVKHAQEETMQQIGSLLEEVLDMSDEQLDKEDEILE